MTLRSTLHDLFIFGIIGFIINSILYTLYLFLTYFYSSPKLIMTLIYFIGILISFFLNRRFIFFYSGRITLVAIRYIFVQILGYLLNFFLLAFFVDFLGYKHQVIQALAIILVAIFLFMSFQNFVFKIDNSNTRASDYEKMS